MDLSFRKYFVLDEDCENGVTIRGNLKCDCGCEQFEIFHSGKQTKGILASHIVKTEHQIMIKAKCSKCGKNIQLYDSAIDGETPMMNNHPDLKQFSYKTNNKFRVNIILNYSDGNYMTNKFFTIYVYLYDKNNKEIVLYEE